VVVPVLYSYLVRGGVQGHGRHRQNQASRRVDRSQQAPEVLEIAEDLRVPEVAELVLCRVVGANDRPCCRWIDRAVADRHPGFGQPEGKDEHVKFPQHRRHGTQVLDPQLAHMLRLFIPDGIDPWTKRIEPAAVLLPDEIGRTALAEGFLRQLQELPRGIDIAVAA
jgi:hypothetical protein